MGAIHCSVHRRKVTSLALASRRSSSRCDIAGVERRTKSNGPPHGAPSTSYGYKYVYQQIGTMPVQVFDGKASNSASSSLIF